MFWVWDGIEVDGIGLNRTGFSVSLGKYEILEKCDFKRVFGGFW